MRALQLAPIEPSGDSLRWLAARQRPTAGLGYSDIKTCRVAGACLSLGLRVPGELSLMGILNYGPALQLGLACHRLDGVALGHAAARMIGNVMMPEASSQTPDIVDLPFVAGRCIGPLASSS